MYILRCGKRARLYLIYGNNAKYALQGMIETTSHLMVLNHQSHNVLQPGQTDIPFLATKTTKSE